MKRINSVGLVIFGMVLAGGLVAAAYQTSRMMIRLERENELAVKGYAETRVKSDRAVLSATVSVASNTLPDCYHRLNMASERIRSLLLKLGFKDHDIAVGVASCKKIPRKDANGKDTNLVEFFQLQQMHAVRTSDVDLVEKSQLQLAGLMAEGIDITVSQPEYYVSDLEKFKLSLIRQATENARQRAMAIAESSGGKMAKLISARQGVFQITSPDSAEISDFGVYDTQSIIKVAKIVMTLKFRLE